MRKITFVTVAVLSALTYSNAISTKKGVFVSASAGPHINAEESKIKVFKDLVDNLAEKSSDIQWDLFKDLIFKDQQAKDNVRNFLNNAIDQGQNALGNVIQGFSEAGTETLSEVEWDLFKDLIFKDQQAKDNVKNFLNGAIDDGQKNLGNFINGLAETESLTES